MKNKPSDKNKITTKIIAFLITVNLLLVGYIFLDDPASDSFFSTIPSSFQSVATQMGDFGQTSEESISPSVEGIMEVNVLDVGQGSSTLIIAEGYTILIDAGDLGEGYKISDYLKTKGITSINLFIASHPHADHIGGMDELMEEVDLQQILMPEIPRSIVPTTRAYLDVLEKIDEQGKLIIPAKSGDEYDVGPMHLKLLAPSLAYNDLNNLSVVAKVTYGTRSVLVSGDAESESEQQMLLFNKSDLASDIYVVGHHGSKTSSTLEYVKAISPTYAAISCGKDNSYGLPKQVILDRLTNIGSTYYRTDESGRITFFLSEQGIEVECEKG